MQTNQPRESTPATKTMNAEKLQEFLRGELSAVETYDLAMKGVEHVGIHHTLQEILASHAQRTTQLSEKLRQLGGAPTKSSGAWGTFAKVVQAGADLLGDRVAVSALEDGEDRGLKLYTESLETVDPTTRRFIETELLPQQQRTHELCRTLKSYMNAPS